jgi:hypothetical protein
LALGTLAAPTREASLFSMRRMIAYSMLGCPRAALLGSS